MTQFIAAALQLGAASPTIGQTTDRILSLMDQAARQGARLAVLPELALSAYFAAKLRTDVSAFVDPLQVGAALDRIAAQARACNMGIVVSFGEATAAGLYNSMAFYDASGTKAGLFRKVHIPGQVDPDPAKPLNILEKRYFKEGDLGFPVFKVDGLKLGGLICYDRRFPESYRSLMLAGADVFCVGYNTPVMDGGTLAEAQRTSELAICGGAYSNGTYAIAAGKAGVEEGATFIGGSFICDPAGQIIAQATSAGDEVICAMIDLAAQTAMRDRWAFAQNRKTASYRLDAAPAEA